MTRKLSTIFAAGGATVAAQASAPPDVKPDVPKNFPYVLPMEHLEHQRVK